MSQSQSNVTESLKRQAWLAIAPGARITVVCCSASLAAVQYGTRQVFYKIVPHFDAQELPSIFTK